MRTRTVIVEVVVLLAVAAMAVAFWPATLGGHTSFVVVQGASMEPHLSGGDLAVVRAGDEYRVGDVVAYRIPAGDANAGRLVIHRIVDVTDRGYVLRGDNRSTDDSWVPTESDIVGRVMFTAPISGNLLLRLVPWLCVMVIGVGLLRLLWRPARPDDSDDPPWPPPTTPAVEMADAVLRSGD